MEGKVCTKCKEFKSKDNYHKCSKVKSGYESRCKECAKKELQAYREKNREKVRARNRKYYSDNKEKCISRVKKWTDKNKDYVAAKNKEWHEKNKDYVAKKAKIYFEENKETIIRKKKEWYSKNKEKMQSYSKEYYHKNRERLIINKRKWDKENPDKLYSYVLKRRSLKRYVQFTTFQRTELLRRDNYTCQQCSVKVHDRRTGNWNDEFKAHIDHIIPISKGGDSTPENLRVLCRTCNLSKSDKTDIIIKEDGQIALFI